MSLNATSHNGRGRTAQKRKRQRRTPLRAAISIAGIAAAIVFAFLTVSTPANSRETGAKPSPVACQVTMARKELGDNTTERYAVSPVELVMEIQTAEPELPYTEEDVTILAQTLYGEARGVDSETEKAAVVWCVLNRVESPLYPDTISEVVTQPWQFCGYNENNPVDEALVELTRDVLNRWANELDGQDDVGRVLPKEYLFFTGDGQRNYFTAEYQSSDVWTWEYVSPYED